MAELCVEVCSGVAVFVNQLALLHVIAPRSGAEQNSEASAFFRPVLRFLQSSA